MRVYALAGVESNNKTLFQTWHNINARVICGLVCLGTYFYLCACVSVRNCAYIRA